MSIVSSPSLSSIPADYIEAVCIGCNAALFVPVGSLTPRCTACQRSDAEAEARKLVADARDLRDGRGIWAAISPEERKEQLDALVVSTIEDKPRVFKPLDESFREFVDCLSDTSLELMADIVARRISERRKPGKTLVQIAIADLSDTALAAVAKTATDPIILNAARAELARRFAGVYVAVCEPVYTSSSADAPDAATRDEIESTIEADYPAVPLADEHPLAGKFDGLDAA